LSRKLKNINSPYGSDETILHEWVEVILVFLLTYLGYLTSLMQVAVKM